MADLLEFRMNKLARMLDHYRHLAFNLQPDPVSDEIVAVVNEFDNEIARMKLECVGKRICPCELSQSCLAVVDTSVVAETANNKMAA